MGNDRTWCPVCRKEKPTLSALHGGPECGVHNCDGTSCALGQRYCWDKEHSDPELLKQHAQKERDDALKTLLEHLAEALNVAENGCPHNQSIGMCPKCATELKKAATALKPFRADPPRQFKVGEWFTLLSNSACVGYSCQVVSVGTDKIRVRACHGPSTDWDVKEMRGYLKSGRIIEGHIDASVWHQRNEAWKELGAEPLGSEAAGCLPCTECKGFRAPGSACACGAPYVPVHARAITAAAAERAVILLEAESCLAAASPAEDKFHAFVKWLQRRSVLEPVPKTRPINTPYWDFIRRVQGEVAKWPAWKKEETYGPRPVGSRR